MDGAATLEVASTLDQLLGDLAPIDRLLHHTASNTADAALLDALDEIGISSLAVAEADGGLALGLDELCLVGWVGGRRLMPTRARLAMTLIGPLFASYTPDFDPRDALWACGFPAVTGPPDTGTADVWMRDGARSALIVGEGDARIVDLDRSDSRLEARPGVDPGQGLHTLTFEPDATTTMYHRSHARIVDRARVLILAELSGIADRITDVSLHYARQRSQFGRPIAEFQAVQHKLADMRAGAELIRSAVSRLAHLDEPRHDLTASLGSAVASVARRVVEDAIQVHGGMGYTWEYGAHLYYRRCLSLQQQLGGADSLSRFVGRSLATKRRTQ